MRHEMVMGSSEHGSVACSFACLLMRGDGRGGRMETRNSNDTRRKRRETMESRCNE